MLYIYHLNCHILGIQDLIDETLADEDAFSKLLILLPLVKLVLRKALAKAFKPNSSDGRQPGNCLTTVVLLVGDILELIAHL